MQKTCGQCRQSFVCRQAPGCWCETPKLNDRQKAWVKQQFENCLCPACLAAVAADRLPDRSPV